MLRKLMTIFSIGAICMLGLTPVLAQQRIQYELEEYEELAGVKLQFQEAPEFRVKVATGELPPVEERLPEELLVLKPLEEIGQYGGVLRQAHIGPSDNAVPWIFYGEHLVRWSQDYTSNIPSVAKRWEFSEDSKRVTFYLREGMKWSDGAPFTADDLMFWYEDIQLNTDLNPVGKSWLKSGGEFGKWRKIDNYTFEITFAKPYATVLELFAITWNSPIAPKHYLKQFHPKYTSMDKIEKKMKEEAFDSWTGLFAAKWNFVQNPEIPTIWAFQAVNDIDQPIQIWKRNPYYWKVDTEGNQLPYIDEYHRYLVSDKETILLKAIAGEIDFQARRLAGFDNYTLAMENREKGDYRMIGYAPLGHNNSSIFFNFFNEDPVLRELFRNREFRIALSIAIDRQEVSDLIFKGIAKPSQPAPAPLWYVEEYAKANTEYDPEKANKTLDELGLKWDKNHEYRLRPDGERLKFVMTINVSMGGDVEIMELVKGYWKEIGIQMMNKPIDRQLFGAKIINALDFDVASQMNYSGQFGRSPVTYAMVFPTPGWGIWSGKWAMWFATDGKSGEEPPEEVKELMEISDEYSSEPSMEKRIALVKDAFKLHAENLWIIGIVERPMQHLFYVVKNDLRNVTSAPIVNAALEHHAGLYFFKR